MDEVRRPSEPRLLPVGTEETDVSSGLGDWATLESPTS
jgi:hypothetical protein